MLQLIYGPPGSGKTQTLLKRLAGDLSAGLSCVLLVPEQQVVLTERKVASLLRGEESLRVEVLSFRRLCNRVFREYGGLCDHYLSEGGQTLLLWQVLRELAPAMQTYGTVNLQDRAVIGKLLEQLRLLKRATVGADELREAAAQPRLAGEKQETLRKKLLDLALLSESYEQALLAGFDDPEGDLPRLCTLLDGCGSRFFEGKTVYLDGFSDLTGQEYAVLERIIRPAASVTATVNMDPDDKRELLSKVEAFRRSLLRIADKAGVGARYDTLPAPTGRPEDLRYLERAFFGGAEENVPACEHLHTFSYENPYAEVAACAERILRDVQQGGQFRDHVIAVRDTGAYEGILESVFDACGIPVFLSRRGRLSEHAAIRAIFHAVEIIRGGWQTDEVLRYVKTGYAGASLSEEDCLLFERYVRSWSIRGSRFFDEYGFTMNPAGYSEQFSEEDLLLLQRLNAFRAVFSAPLVKFGEAFHGNPTAGELSEALYTFLCEIGMKESLRAEAEAARRDGRTEDAERLAQLWSLICQILDTLHESAARLPCTAALFSELLQTVFTAEDLGSVPTALDQVTFSDALLLRGDGVKTVHLLGVNEGIFPATPGGSGVFSDPDLRLLRELTPAIDLSVDSFRLSCDELHAFYLCLAMPRQELYVSFSRKNLAGSQLEPSDALAQVLQLFGKETKDIPAAETLPLSERIFSRRAALEQLAAETPAGSEHYAAALRELLADALPDRELVIGEARIGEEAAARLFGRDVSLSPSSLENYVNCPLSYHLRNTLRLSEEKAAEPKPSDRGTIIHLLLERFLRKMKDENRFDGGEPITDEEISDLTAAILREYCETVCGGSEPVPKLQRLLRQTGRLAELLLRDLREEFTVGGFRPAFFELPIGPSRGDAEAPDGIRLPMLELPLAGGGFVRVRGTIDRVDGLRTGDGYYLRVVDYKTYDKKLKTGDIEKRKNLQMLVYLLALCRDGQEELREKLGLAPGEKVKPAGTLYYIAQVKPVETTSADTAETVESRALRSLERNGLVVDADEVAAAADPEGNGRFLPKKSLLSESELAAALSRTEEKLREVAEELRMGKADAAPLKEGNDDGCKYCPMNPVCRRRYAVSGDDDDDENDGGG